MIKMVYWSSCKIPVFFCQTSMKFEMSRHTFEKYSDIKFNENPPVGAKLFHADHQTVRHDAADSRFRNFCERA